MEKPVWRVRSSRYVIESRHMRLRVDEIELPDGTIVPEYFVREGSGFVSMLPLTDDGRAVLVRQYRYGADTMTLELPAGSIDRDETPAACAARELAEETGFEAERWELAASYAVEPVRSSARAHVFVAFGARLTGQQNLDVTEHLSVELVELAELRSMLKDGRIDPGSSLIAGYRALDYLGKL
ncbi:MAG: NUDIX hydrolase [Candidatus Eremiobacteraeota bacterium]|nr:NUDIX hydrolase [Candidatus Eremiobacteraeota bacterium]